MLKNLFGRKPNNEPFEIAGATLGGFTQEVEGIITLENIGEYFVKSYNNSSGTCSFVTLIPLDSEEELRWLTERQTADLFNFLEKDFGGRFGDGQVLENDKDNTEYLSFEANGCEIILFLMETNGPMIRPEVHIRHLDAYEQIQREMNTFSTYEEWLDNRKIR